MTFFALSTNPLRLDSASGLAREVERLRTENAQLRRAVDSHALADQAIGVLVALARITPEDGWTVLREVSQRTNTKLRTVAENVLAFARDGHLEERLRTELHAALRRLSELTESSRPSEGVRSSESAGPADSEEPADSEGPADSEEHSEPSG
jgi:hypothetical protein